MYLRKQEEYIMLTFEEFKKYIDYIKREDEFFLKLSDLYREYRDVVGDAEAPFSIGGNHIISLLEEIMNLEIDDSGYSDLSWWVYECNYGKDTEKVDSYELTNLPENHKYRKPKLHTVKELYDFLVWRYNPETIKQYFSEK
jgi:hypothetical protein